MKNYRIAAICFLSAVSLAACSPAGTDVSFPNTIQVENGESQSTIEVSGRETVKIEPDKASITYAISTQDADSAICQQENTKKMNALVEYLKAQGFEDASISTSGFTMNPLYDWSGSEQRVTGYEMRTQITVSDVEMDRVGELLSGGVARGPMRSSRSSIIPAIMMRRTTRRWRKPSPVQRPRQRPWLMRITIR